MLGQLLGVSKDYSFVEPVTSYSINQTMAFISSSLNTLDEKGTGAMKVPQSS